MSSVRKRGKNKWQLRVRSDIVNGKYTYIYRTVEARNKTEAERLLREWEYEIDKGNYKKPERTLMKDLIDEWLTRYAPAFFEETTVILAENTIRNHIRPQFDHMEVRRITPKMIFDFLDNAKSVKEDRELSSNSKVNIYRFLGDILARGVDWGIIKDNPIDAVRRPTIKKVTEYEVYTIDEVAQLVELLEQAPLHWRCFIYLAIFGGLRRSEIIGLRPEAIDFDNSSVNVTMTTVRGQGGRQHKEPKSKRSKREVTMPDFVMRGLQDLIKRKRREKLMMGSRYEDEGFIFSSERGKQIYPTSPNKWWKRFCDRNEFRYISVHYLRHSHISIALSFGGSDPNTISKRAGHSTSRFTIDVYGHRLQDADKRVADVFDDQFKKRDKA